MLIFESLIAEKTSFSLFKNNIQSTAVNLWQPYLFLSTLESTKWQGVGGKKNYKSDEWGVRGS